MPTMSSALRAAASSRDIAYSADVRSSRSRAASACCRIRAVSRLITMATTSITPKVSTYRASDTAKVLYGRTNQKSNAAMLKTDASRAGRGGNRDDTTTTARR